MKKHFKYLRYVLKHKWYVYQECRKLGVGRWQAFIHDFSKFSLAEWRPYVEYFNGNHKPYAEYSFYEQGMISNWQITEFVELSFNRAWNHHQKVNPHHWQYWVMIEDEGSVVALEMPLKYVFEMIADWRGVGLAIHGKDDTVNWYFSHKDRYVFHPATRRQVEYLLGIDNK